MYLQNTTEIAEQRFNVSSITAGWHSATSQCAGKSHLILEVVSRKDSKLIWSGFFIVPLLGAFLDLFAASLGVFAFAYCFGPTTIIDSIRTSIWNPSVFGSAYALKITMNNAMNIIVRVITGVMRLAARVDMRYFCHWSEYEQLRRSEMKGEFRKVQRQLAGKAYGESEIGILDPDT
ncbi:hypothetical protein CIB48_g1930 [Xylaria polymorpha]|nr:hypothetical protein CIB48_g1930 [Xylaria polymorpha]